MAPQRSMVAWPANAWRIALWATIAGLLLLPVAAMQVTREMAWGKEDFAAAALLLAGAGLAFEVAAGLTASPARRATIGAALVLAVAVIWAEAAVGLF